MFGSIRWCVWSFRPSSPLRLPHLKCLLLLFIAPICKQASTTRLAGVLDLEPGLQDFTHLLGWQIDMGGCAVDSLNTGSLTTSEVNVVTQAFECLGAVALRMWKGVTDSDNVEYECASYIYGSQDKSPRNVPTHLLRVYTREKREACPKTVYQQP